MGRRKEDERLVMMETCSRTRVGSGSHDVEIPRVAEGFPSPPEDYPFGVDDERDVPP